MSRLATSDDWQTTGMATAPGAPLALPDHYPGTDGLDALELHRAGVIPAELVGLGSRPVRVVDVEGVPVATVNEDAQITWLSPRSTRPFEELHVRQHELSPPLVLVDSLTALTQVPDHASTIAVLASTDGPDRAGDLALVRSARQRAQALGAALAVIPLGRQAPGRAAKLAHVRDAYAPAVDLTGDEPAEAGAPPTGGVVIFMTGLSGSGKSTVARALHHYLVEETDRAVSLLDGDDVRRHLSKGLTFSAQDRDINIRRIGWVAAEIARHGGIAICSPIAPFDATRRHVRTLVESRGGSFLLVHVATPLEECERRDRKGLYAAARRGEVADFTGISSPYQHPEDADLRLDTTGMEVTQLRTAVLDTLRGREWLAL